MTITKVLLSMILCCIVIVHCFQSNELFMFAGNDVVKSSLSVWPVQVRKKKRQEGRKEGRKAGRKKSHKKCIFHVCVERLLAG